MLEKEHDCNLCHPEEHHAKIKKLEASNREFERLVVWLGDSAKNFGFDPAYWAKAYHHWTECPQRHGIPLSDAEKEIQRLQDDIAVGAKHILSLEEKLKQVVESWGRDAEKGKALESSHSALREIAEGMVEYIRHDMDCIRSMRSAGEPTEGGGYREQYKGRWYQSEPIDETPECECGRDKVYQKFARWQTSEAKIRSSNE